MCKGLSKKARPIPCSRFGYGGRIDSSRPSPYGRVSSPLSLSRNILCTYHQNVNETWRLKDQGFRHQATSLSEFPWSLPYAPIRIEEVMPHSNLEQVHNRLNEQGPRASLSWAGEWVRSGEWWDLSLFHSIFPFREWVWSLSLFTVCLVYVGSFCPIYDFINQSIKPARAGAI